MADRNADLNQISGGIMAEELFKEGSNELPTISAKIQHEDNAYPFKFDQSLPEIPVPKQSDDKVESKAGEESPIPLCNGKMVETTAKTNTKVIIKTNKRGVTKLRYVGDSGCGRHASGFRDELRNIRRTQQPVTVNLPDGRSHVAQVEGDMDMWVQTDHGPALIELQNVLYVEALDKTLVSLKSLAKLGYEFRLSKDLMVITPMGHSFVVLRIDII
jgi:hypothetical protein